MKNNSLRILIIFTCLALAVNRAQGDQLLKPRHITEAVSCHHESMDDRQRAILAALEKHSDMLTTDELLQISTIFEDYTNSLSETETNEYKLLEILAANYINILHDYSSKMSQPERDMYFKQRQKLFQNERLLRARARSILASKGDQAIDLVLKHRSIRSNSYPKQAIYTISEIGTDKAKQTLLDIIFNRLNMRSSVDDSIALTCYLSIVDIDEARQLLILEDIEMFTNVLKKYPVLATDPKAFNRLSNLLLSDNYHQRWAANSIIRSSPPEMIVKEKAYAIAESLKTVHQLPKANERFDTNFYIGTYSDNLYEQLHRTLKELKAADQVLREITAGLDGQPRLWVIVTRAGRGDLSAKEELIAILKDESLLERTLLRNRAVSAMEVVGTKEDVPLLKQIMENDPVELLMRGGPLLERVNGKAINNTGDRAVMVYDELINYDPWEDAQITYPIRAAAYRAMEQISNER